MLKLVLLYREMDDCSILSSHYNGYFNNLRVPHDDPEQPRVVGMINNDISSREQVKEEYWSYLVSKLVLCPYLDMFAGLNLFLLVFDSHAYNLLFIIANCYGHVNTSVREFQLN